MKATRFARSALLLSSPKIIRTLLRLQGPVYGADAGEYRVERSGLEGFEQCVRGQFTAYAVELFICLVVTLYFVAL